VPVEEATNGKNGDAKETEKLSLGEIAAIDEGIANAKIDQLQPLHNVSHFHHPIEDNSHTFSSSFMAKMAPPHKLSATFENLPASSRTSGRRSSISC
jgi:hypothetical protein